MSGNGKPGFDLPAPGEPGYSDHLNSAIAAAFILEATKLVDAVEKVAESIESIAVTLRQAKEKPGE